MQRSNFLADIHSKRVAANDSHPKSSASRNFSKKDYIGAAPIAEPERPQSSSIRSKPATQPKKGIWINSESYNSCKVVAK